MALDFSLLTSNPPKENNVAPSGGGIDFSKLTSSPSIKTATPYVKAPEPAPQKNVWEQIWGGAKITAKNVVSELGGVANEAKNFLTNPQPDNPLLIKNIGKNIYNYETDLGQKLQPLTTQSGRDQMTKNAVKSIVDTNTGIADTVNKIADTFSKPNQASKQSAFQTVSDLANYVGSGANVLLAPVMYANNAAEKVPFLKPAADEFNFIFSNLGKVKTPIKGFVNALPDSLFSTPEVKSNFGDSIGDLGSLGAQIIFGGMIMELGGKGKVVDNAKINELIDKTKSELEKVPNPEDIKSKISDIAKKHLSNIEEAPKTAPIEITNKLTDEGYSKQDISRIVSDLYNKKPDGIFTEEDINNAKSNYIPKGKDAATVISDLTDKGYTPEEQNTILKNLHDKNPDGNFLKANINAETQALKSEDLYKTEGAKAEEVKAIETAKAKAITEKEVSKAKAETEKFNAKVKQAQDVETKAKTEHDNAKNASELAKGKIEDVQKDYEKSQKEQQLAQKRLQEANTKEQNARIRLYESKVEITDKQSKGDKQGAIKAKISLSKARVEATKAKIELQQAKEEVKNATDKTKSLQKELIKAKIEATKAEKAISIARSKYVKAQKNTQDVKATEPKAGEKFLPSPEAIKDAGGITINTKGESPMDGYTYSPDKTTEFSKTQDEMTDLDIDTFFNKNYDEIVKDGNFFGAWVDKGRIYLDVSKNVTNEHEAVVGAKASDQIGIYDVKNGTTKYTEAYNLNPEGVFQHQPDVQTRLEQEANARENQGNAQREGTAEKVNNASENASQTGGGSKVQGNKVGKSVQEINYKLSKEGFDSLPEEEQAKYNSSTKTKQIYEISQLLLDKENFKSISVGDRPLPEGIKGPVLWNTARAVAYKDGDFEWFAKLGSSPLGAESSEAASKLSLSRFGKSEDRAEVAVGKNMKMAEEAVKNPKAEKVKSDIIKETKETIKKEADKQTLEDFLGENNCG